MTRKDVVQFGREIGVRPYPGDKNPQHERHKRRIFAAIVDLELSDIVAKNAIEALEDTPNWEHEDVLRVLRAYGRSLDK